PADRESPIRNLKSEISDLPSPSPFLRLLCRAVLVYSLGVWQTPRRGTAFAYAFFFEWRNMAVPGGDLTKVNKGPLGVPFVLADVAA
ncbi:MAG: hypothetical protein AMK72_13910, partial [Planctomycetes bacterium SM23_25]